MWFKQAQIFTFSSPISSDATAFEAQLEKLPFTSCLPTLASSVGWTSPMEEEEAPLVEAMPGYFMLCCQFEEKILPTAVVHQKLKETIKQRESDRARKIRFKEKQNFKDEIIHSLLPKAFTKLTRLYAYVDIHHQWLVINTINPKKTDTFISILKRCLQQDIQPLSIKKPAPIMTRWLTGNPSHLPFEIEKACVLQDPRQQQRMIRCQEQDLLDKNIQALIKAGFEIKQLALSWQDQIKFVLSDDLSLHSIHFQDNVMVSAKEAAETEDPRLQFYANSMIMMKSLSLMLSTLLTFFIKETSEKSPTKKLTSAMSVG